ncbi:LuxR family transcriptional regulator [Siculibacillus lacustris]|uniref:LuxR family transcriptional regulator n=1 Tax=Siculibacillus lacustris TaxID=1549641 RepID=A0A4V2KT95_9HYPH|nr:LuxR family transcriptional regulator [Siculibacillus lacustris]TBW36276.1 LuxR family transcriptional regulator [Siculibacillus lacustris]
MDRLQTALDFIGDIAAEVDVNQMLARLSRIAGGFGFDSFLLTGVPDPGRRIDGYIMLSGWSEAWLDRYVSQDYVQVDPIARRLQSVADPFVWSEVMRGLKPDPMGRRVMDEAASIGMRDGLCVPLYDRVRGRSVLSLAARTVDLSPADRAVLHLVGMYAQSRIRTLLDPAPHVDEHPRLSPRERECLQWTAAGKTSWEISAILGLSQSTTDGYIASATRKLGAVNRTQAVAEGIRRGLID